MIKLENQEFYLTIVRFMFMKAPMDKTLLVMPSNTLSDEFKLVCKQRISVTLEESWVILAPIFLL